MYYQFKFSDMIKTNLLIVLSLILALICQCNNHSISKRAFLFPRATVLQFTYGLTVPVVLPKRSINLSMCAQVNYNLPFNLSNFTPLTIATRENNNFLDISRKRFYKFVIQYLDEFGLDGEECLLRSICEIAETPVHIKDEDTLLEKIVHFIFTPSLEMEANTNNLTKVNNLKFVDKLLLAEKLGRNEGDCSDEYSDCIVSIVDLFTEKYII